MLFGKDKHRYFSQDELRCKCGCARYFFDDKTLKVLNKIRESCNFPFVVSSGCRCEQHPVEAKKLKAGKKIGTHGHGKAVDLLCNGEQALKLLFYAQAHGITRIGVKQKGRNRFIHLDTCEESEGFPTQAIWSY